MEFVCPQCRGVLQASPDEYRCAPCRQVYPVICGIPDFRLFPDPYIGIEADRVKGRMLADATRDMPFAEAVRYYYSITPDDPSDLAAIWTRRALAEVEIARAMLAVVPACGPILDIGCSTGAVLIAAGGGTGVDIAFRWLVLGLVRLREAGVQAQLVCANAEHLPFPPSAFERVTCFDTLEHLRDAPRALSGMQRSARTLLLTSNNRWAPVPEPHVHLWGVGWLPRRWQVPYVAWRRGDLHPYRIHLRSAAEGYRMAAEAGWGSARVEAAPLFAPHMAGAAASVLSIYNAVRRWPLMRWIGPRWMLRAQSGSFPKHGAQGEAASE